MKRNEPVQQPVIGLKDSQIRLKVFSHRKKATQKSP
jgi:hypothetical protein